jgi:hypothetical protein
MESLDALAGRLRTADIVDAMGRRHRHRCHLLDLVSPTPGRRLFGAAVIPAGDVRAVLRAATEVAVEDAAAIATIKSETPTTLEGNEN